MKVGIMGGTFDPIHLGHLMIAEEARSRLELDKVLFIPAGSPWMKSDLAITPAKHRVEMVRLAINSNPAFSLLTMEVDRPGFTFTVDTLEELGERLGAHTELFLLMSWDSIRYMPEWKSPERIPRVATLVSFPRPGFERPDFNAMESVMPGISRRAVAVDEPYTGISSTMIRERVAAGKSIRYLVPDPVIKYIVKHGLYRK